MGIWEFMVVREVWPHSIRGEKKIWACPWGGGGNGEKEKTL